MKPRSCFHVRPFVLTTALALVASGLARATDATSPFDSINPAAVTTVSNTALDALELRHVTSIGGSTWVTLFDTTTSKSITVEVNEGANNWKVTGYNAAEDTVMVESGGRSRSIVLRKPKILAAAVPVPQMPVAMPMPGQPPQPGMQQPPFVPANATPIPQMTDAETRERMNNVAQEIQRRRQMRREMIDRAAPGGQQPAAGNVPVPPAQP